MVFLGTFKLKKLGPCLPLIKSYSDSNLRHFLTFEVISCEPASPVTSAIHTIALKKVTSNNSTFIEWTSDFSNDATAEIISDSRFKRLDAFGNLSARFHS